MKLLERLVLPNSPKSELQFGAFFSAEKTHFSVWSPDARQMWVCLFDDEDTETQRIAMSKHDDGTFSVGIDGICEGQRYGYRADGPYYPGQGYWFDPNKLLIDPYATQLDRPFVYNEALTYGRDHHFDTADLMPKAVVCAPLTPVDAFKPALGHTGLIYELQVRSFTKTHPDIPEEIRGTVKALSHPVIVDHLISIGVDAVELMPITAWIDERHLGPLGMNNAWGYNPVSYFALDPRLAPDGITELRQVVETLHEAGISVLQDVVFNHNGESDIYGPTMSFRGLDARGYFRNPEGSPGELINDTGCGNSIDCNHPVVRRLILDSMRYFVKYAGIDGFRFDLGPALGRHGQGDFDPAAPLLSEMMSDDVLKDRILIAEPWDIGPGGYQLGKFPQRFLEWNDTYRDDVRRFWRGDQNALGQFVTRLTGSQDIYGKSGEAKSRSIGFIAAHDGFSFADLVSYEHKHNEANGEENRDGHSENISWNNGVEGRTEDSEIISLRKRDIMALLSTLYASKGPIMLTAGDEFGRTQKGNNNAYAQDNEITWLDWERADNDLLNHTRKLADFRKRHPQLTDRSFLQDKDVRWLRSDGQEMGVSDWEKSDAGSFAVHYKESNILILFNRHSFDTIFYVNGNDVIVAARSVECVETSSDLNFIKTIK